jgi:hypothetical protein
LNNDLAEETEGLKPAYKLQKKIGKTNLKYSLNT